jgi:hypothetical protein
MRQMVSYTYWVPISQLLKLPLSAALIADPPSTRAVASTGLDESSVHCHLCTTGLSSLLLSRYIRSCETARPGPLAPVDHQPAAVGSGRRVRSGKLLEIRIRFRMPTWRRPYHGWLRWRVEA